MKGLQSTSALSEPMKHWSRFDLVSGQAQHLLGMTKRPRGRSQRGPTRSAGQPVQQELKRAARPACWHRERENARLETFRVELGDERRVAWQGCRLRSGGGRRRRDRRGRREPGREERHVGRGDEKGRAAVGNREVSPSSDCLMLPMALTRVRQ
jgi:hypothetical protein